MKNRKGMTLLEMLVVIGIIGILAAVLLSQFGGATESAKAAQCMNNMRSLAVGVINAATANDYGHYPPALSFKSKPEVNDQGELVYYTHKGWISWTMRDDNYSKNEGNPNYCGQPNLDTLMFALTNGAVWTASGRSRAAYVCPVHAKMFKDKNGREPGWSYVMNREFGCPGYRQWRAMGSSPVNGKSPDKVLLFAEMQGYEFSEDEQKRLGGLAGSLKVDTSGMTSLSDSILNYNDGEVIGFNHKMSGGKFMGHVAFTDGHVEKLMLPKSGSLTELTKWLCTGIDVSFNGSQYSRADQ